MNGTNHTSIQPLQAKFDIYGVFTRIDNICSVAMSYFKQDFVGPLKNNGALSTDLRVQMRTKFMKASSRGSLMAIPVILVKYKYPNLCIYSKEVNGSSFPNIGHRT